MADQPADVESIVLQAINRVIREATEAIRLDPQDGRAYADRGFAFDALRKDQEAENDWHEAHRIDGSLAEDYYRLGEAYRAIAFPKPENFSRAIAAYTKAIQLDPSYAMAYQRRGKMHWFSERFQQAAADFSSASEHFTFWFQPDCLPNYVPFVNTPDEPSTGIQFASDLPWLRASSGYTFDVPYRNRRFHHGSIHIAGRKYHKGFYTHSFHDGRPADIVFDISGRKFAEFKSDVGHPFYWKRAGSVQFQVLADGELKARSPVLRMRELHSFQVDVSGARQVTLRVTDGGDGFSGDHAAWGNSRFIKANAEDH